MGERTMTNRGENRTKSDDELMVLYKKLSKKAAKAMDARRVFENALRAAMGEYTVNHGSHGYTERSADWKAMCELNRVCENTDSGDWMC